MKSYRPLLCIALSLLFMCSIFRPGNRIIVNGIPLPGIYEPQLVRDCSQKALRAAEEITRQAETPSYKLIPVLCLTHAQADPSHLWGLLLESFEGVEKLYTVSMGDHPIGTVSNLRDVYAIKRTYFPAWSKDTALTIRETYTYAEAETSEEELHAVFQRLSSPILPT